MKRFLLSITLTLLLLPLSLRAEVTLGGSAYTVDTLTRYMVGPGTYYTQVRLFRQGSRDNRRDVYILQVDRRNPYVSVHTVLANDSIEKGEEPSHMAQRKSQTGQRYFAGTNGDWWSTDRPGVPEGAFVTENTIAITPQNGRATLAMCAIDQNDSLYYGHDFFTDVWLETDNNSVRCSHVNDIRYENELVLYNSYNGTCTHTDNSGTEVLCRILPGSAWGTNTTLQAEVVRIESGKGNMHIEDGCFVLSARDDMQQHLTALTEGQQIRLRIATSINGTYADFKAALGGQDRTFMLVNGVVDNNWDERHPRTGLGFSVTGDTIIHCVVDGRGKSIGATTGELAEIMQFFGAYNAMNMEGGGSSTMYLASHGVMNVPSDGHERAESQGIFAVSSAPDDEMLAKIAAYTPSVSMPRYGTLTPSFLGYNQYDMLLNTDMQGVTLSCDPSVGYIETDGRFVCQGSGELIAALDDIRTSIHVQMVADAPIALRLDSVLVSDATAYPIEVESTIGSNTITLLPEALTWIVRTPSVAVVSAQGVISGLTDGYTWVIGQLGEFSDSLLVHVQTTDAKPYLWIRGMDGMTINQTTAATKWLAHMVNTADIPSLAFNYSGARNPQLTFNADMRIYADPDYLELRLMLPEEKLIKLLSVQLTANGYSVPVLFNMEQFMPGQLNRIIINLDSLFRQDAIEADLPWHNNDQSIYPVTLNSVSFTVSKDATKQSYSIPVYGWYLHFGEVSVLPTDTDDALMDAFEVSIIRKISTVEGVIIQRGGEYFDLLGRPIMIQ